MKNWGEIVGNFFVGLCCLTFALAVCITFHTDEYVVADYKSCGKYHSDTGECSKYNTYYVCKVDNGHTLFQSESLKEANQFCERKRGSNE